MSAHAKAQVCAKDDLWFYGGSKLALRGPVPEFDQPFAAILGGSETFGKFVDLPYPALLQDRIGMPVANLGVMHAGVSLFSKERWLLEIASKAEVTVLQVLGAQNMSNRLYCVHPRRNDRFLTISSALREIYPEIDFAEVNFTGHLLSALEITSSDRFSVVVEELRWAWVQRMRRVVKSIRSDVVLLWLSERDVENPSDQVCSSDPMFVNRAMLDELAPFTAGLIEIVRKRPGSPGPDLPFGCGSGEAQLHEEVADALARDLKPMLDERKRAPTRLSRPLT